MNTKLSFLLICLFILVCIAGCRKNTSPPSAPSSSSAPSSAPIQPVQPEGGNTTLAEVKYFKGSIGDSLDLQMKLFRTGEQLTGNYYYQKIGTRIDLRGTVDKENNVTLEEFDGGGKQTGMFKGVWQTDAKDGRVTIAGNWSKPPGDKAADKKTAFSIHEEPIYLSGAADVSSKSIKENNKKLVYEIDAQYPQITGVANENFEKFNQVARGVVVKQVSEFRKDVAPKPDEEPRPENSMGSDLSITYEIMLAQDDLVSVTFLISSYYQGAAHPNSFSEVINYDLKNAKILKLADLFQPGAKYLQSISSYCIADLKKQNNTKGPDGLLDDSSITSGASASPKNYRSWTITKSGLGINFDPYQVGPYAAGDQFVTVPYSAIKDLINPEGPIAQFAK
jgi:Protein of unknown function (DUF3298)/Deacetylase PdaC